MPPDAALGFGAAWAFLHLAPLALGYLGAKQWPRHRGSAALLSALAGLIFGELFNVRVGGSTAWKGDAGQGPVLVVLGFLALIALGWKLALRRRPGFRAGETRAERLLPILIVGNLLFLALAWPALQSWRSVKLA